jgi:hypothetical protein
MRWPVNVPSSVNRAIRPGTSFLGDPVSLAGYLLKIEYHSHVSSSVL